jgi:hypothetical protein
MLEVFELEVTVVDHRIAQEVQELYRKIEGVENLHFLAFDFLLTFGCVFDLSGLGRFAMDEVLGEFLSFVEGDHML